MLDYYLLLTSNSTFITDSLYFGTIQICWNLNEHHYCLTSTKPNLFKKNCQIDATCSPFQSLDMFPFQIRLACLKLTYHRLISNFSRYYFKTGTLCLLFSSFHVLTALEFDSNYFGILLWKIVKRRDNQKNMPIFQKCKPITHYFVMS